MNCWVSGPKLIVNLNIEYKSILVVLELEFVTKSLNCGRHLIYHFHNWIKSLLSSLSLSLSQSLNLSLSHFPSLCLYLYVSLPLSFSLSPSLFLFLSLSPWLPMAVFLLFIIKYILSGIASSLKLAFSIYLFSFIFQAVQTSVLSWWTSKPLTR